MNKGIIMAAKDTSYKEKEIKAEEAKENRDTIEIDEGEDEEEVVTIEQQDVVMIEEKVLMEEDTTD